MKLIRMLLIAYFFTLQTLAAQTYVEMPPSNAPSTQTWWNLIHYDINLMPDLTRQTINGYNNIQFRVIKADSILQIDLQNPMIITSVVWQNTALPFLQHGNMWMINFPKALKTGSIETIHLVFSGTPTVAKKPPFDSGRIWSKDDLGRPWISVACEGSGASIWLPSKETAYDEPDSGVTFSITVPDSLVAVANGRLIKTVHQFKDNHSTYVWQVKSPINGYDIVPYIGKYKSLQEEYAGLNGKLDCAYWVLDYNLDRAKNHFTQVDTMLQCFEYWLGPYPFYVDSYKIVEAPMVGMEHQSAIAYGNKYSNSYLGRDLSKSGWGMKWDFILVHESGHEWFGNSITASQDYESWIHEGFTKYSETLYTDFVFGTEAGNDYSVGIFKRIVNDTPVIGSNSSDAYNKSSAMLHYLRQIVGDTAFRALLTGLNKTFYHQTVSSIQIFEYINQHTIIDVSSLFQQYLMSTKVPILEYKYKKNDLFFRWSNCIPGFNMPLRISSGANNSTLIMPTENWSHIPFQKTDSLCVDRNFYVQTRNIK
jgi:aminopeptidase N